MTIEVCVGSACYIKGSYDIISELQSLTEETGLEDQVKVKAAFCLGNCANGVSVKFEGEDKVFGLSKKTVPAFFEQEVKSRL